MADPEYPLKTKPYEHQAREFRLHRDARARALIWHMRTGKTKAMVDLACYLWQRCEIDGVVVVAPNNVHINWHARELPIHHWDSVPRTSFVWEASAVDAAYDKRFDNFTGTDKALAWYMVNAEALGLEKGRKYLADFVKSRWRILLIVDEVHEFRWATSKRSQALRGLANKVAYKRILSANPTDNSPLHAFAEFEVLEPGALGFDKFSDFEAEYAVKEEIYVPGGVNKRTGTKRPPRKRLAVVGYKNQEKLRAQIAKWSSLVTRDMCGDMPLLVKGSYEFELTPLQKRLHNQLVTGALARLDGGELIPPAEGGVLLIRLQQIASGYTIDDEGHEIELMPDKENPRLQALLSAARQAPGKFLVWCRFRPDVVKAHQFLNDYGIKAGHYYGGTTKKQRATFERAFREDPSFTAIVGQYVAGGQGLDFSTAEDVFWYSHTSDLLRRHQADERATKIGGKRISITDLIATGSNDTKFLADLESKSVTADYLTGSGLRRYLETIR